jgi:hypothetical protein
MMITERNRLHAQAATDVFRRCGMHAARPQNRCGKTISVVVYKSLTGIGRVSSDAGLAQN